MSNQPAGYLPGQDPNAGRTGKVFCLRIGDGVRRQLEEKARVAEPLMPTDDSRRKGSLGAFLVWAGLQWAPNPDMPLPPHPAVRAAAGAFADLVMTKVRVPRRRRGNTKVRAKAKRKGKPRPKAKRPPSRAGAGRRRPKKGGRR